MDRMLLESFPFRIIEGLAIAAVAVGAHEGFFYIRREYPLAVERIRAAIAQLEEGYRTRAVRMVIIGDPFFSELEPDARYRDLMARMRLPIRQQ